MMVSNKKLGKGLSSLLGNKADLNLENKKNNFNIKNLYLNIKKEAKYKKLSFLTY